MGFDNGCLQNPPWELSDVPYPPALSSRWLSFSPGEICWCFGGSSNLSLYQSKSDKNGLKRYCWWKKSCTTWDVKKPRKLWDKLPTVSTGARSQPSTVSQVITAHRTCHSWREFSDGCECPFQRRHGGGMENFMHFHSWHLQNDGLVGKRNLIVVNSFPVQTLYIHNLHTIHVGRASSSGTKLSMIIVLPKS